ncbi:GNAT family N-acetyltransferase [Streptomyces sp. R-74717]|uniref:GNAT family N-acetyltransferase n=1 Tax=Streptomyces TaxID=1883 RepID=UPI0037AF9068
MTGRSDIVVVRRPGRHGGTEDEPARLLTAYHLRTQAEKGEAVAGAAELPDRYRAEISDPRTAFHDDVVLLPLSGDTPVGCVVVTAAVEGRSEIKRLWTDPEFRGRGIASCLTSAALAHAEQSGVGTVRRRCRPSGRRCPRGPHGRRGGRPVGRQAGSLPHPAEPGSAPTSLGEKFFEHDRVPDRSGRYP